MEGVLRHLDLFSGYGGFTISAQKLGWETIGFSEIDKYACSVLNYHYPNIKNYGDITKIKGEDLPAVDIITGGSPCQDLSVAGKGAGLDGARSGLFFHFIRLIKEKQPTYFIWENVKGAFSSSKGWDFATVQIEMEQAGYDVWWQLINAKDFGVPQNRERIFAIGIRKGGRREILFEQRESRQNPKQIVEGSQGSRVYDDTMAVSQKALGGGQGAKTGLYAVAARNRGEGKQAEFNNSGNVNSITSVQTDSMVAVDITRRAKTGYKLRKENNVGTITSTYYKGIGNAERPGVIVHNLQPRSQVTEVKAIKYGQNNPDRNGNTSDEMFTLKSGSSHAGVLQVIGNLYNSGGENGDVLSVEGVSKTLKSGETSTKGNGGIGSSNSPKILDDMRIRRLTPLECERLMGLEDGWTAKGIIDGKEVDISDTQRYKMCGNGVVVNCVDYIYSLIKQ